MTTQPQHSTAVRRWTPGRWFGIALLGLLLVVASSIAYGASPAAILGLPLLGGLAALVVGIVGAAVALIRS